MTEKSQTADDDEERTLGRKTIILRVPQDVADLLQQDRKEAERSLNGEVIWIVRQYFKASQSRTAHGVLRFAPEHLALLRTLYAVASWAAEAIPDTLAATFGDISSTLDEAEALLREQED